MRRVYESNEEKAQSPSPRTTPAPRPSPSPKISVDVVGSMLQSIADPTASVRDVEQSCIALYCLTASGPNPQLRHEVRIVW